jgi:hypothetical protein
MYEAKTKTEKDFKDKISKNDEESVLDKIKELEEWLSSHPSESKTVYDEKKKELETIFVEVMNRAATHGTVPNMPPGNGVPFTMDTLPPRGKPDFTGMSNDDDYEGVCRASKTGSLPDMKETFDKLHIDEVD